MNKLIHIICKLLLKTIQKLEYGNGSTIPGHIALFLNKNILRWYSNKLKKGVILVTGTNGKTTTSHLIKEGLVGFGQNVVFSSTGANLENGVISSFVNSIPFFSNKAFDYGVFEVDELNLKLITNKIQPKVIVFLNLSRDQLDRYAELEVIFNSWQDSIKDLNNTNIYIYKKDKNLQKLVGKHIKKFNKETNLFSNIKGDFNNINLSASFSVLSTLFPDNEEKIKNILENFSPVFGRGEKFIYNDNKITSLLNKNPASFNENLKLVTDLSPTYPQVNNIVVIGLNNNIADGKDISWIYDVRSDLILELDKNIDMWICLGGRYIDMANRLKYAGIKQNKIVLLEDFNKLKNYINDITGKNIWILPTYTSMLTMCSIFNQSILGRSIKA